MATWKSAAYDGRYLQLDISESVNVVGNSSTLSWTLTSTGGASTYYTIDTTTVTINGTTVYSKGRTYWDDRVFPARKVLSAARLLWLMTATAANDCGRILDPCLYLRFTGIRRQHDADYH